MITENISTREGLRHFRKSHYRASCTVDEVWRRVLAGRISLVRAHVQRSDRGGSGPGWVRLPLPVPSWVDVGSLPDWVGVVDINRGGALFTKFFSENQLPQGCSATGVVRIAFEKGVRYQGPVQNLRSECLWTVGNHELRLSHPQGELSSGWWSINFPNKPGE